MSHFIRRWRIWLLAFAIWTLLGVFFTLQTYLFQQFAAKVRADLPAQTSNISSGELLRLNLIEFYLWASITPLVFLLGRQFPLRRGRLKISLPIHVLACVIVAVAETAVSTILNNWLRTNAPKPSLSVAILQLYVLARFHQNILFYWIILGVGHAVDYYRKYRERELRATQLQAQLVQAQLKVLKMQLHPHFLFNTLNAISALMYQDVELADRMIARLGELLRATLENADRQEVPLREELDFIEPYLEIEKARFGPRLNVRVSVDSDAMNCLVPNMILQPLVENAIRHGIAPRQEPGWVEISAHRENGSLKLKVSDNGPGITPGAPPKSQTGLGLSNTRSRLLQLYGPEQGLELSNGALAGLEVLVSIPFHETLDEVDLSSPVDLNDAANADRG
jgi:two-component system, LytTR family, sensor kinase